MAQTRQHCNASTGPVLPGLTPVDAFASIPDGKLRCRSWSGMEKAHPSRLSCLVEGQVPQIPDGWDDWQQSSDALLRETVCWSQLQRDSLSSLVCISQCPVAVDPQQVCCCGVIMIDASRITIIISSHSLMPLLQPQRQHQQTHIRRHRERRKHNHQIPTCPKLLPPQPLIPHLRKELPVPLLSPIGTDQ